MPRVIWKGSISFGLVHVPVALYSAERREDLHFAMLDQRDMAPVGYKRFNKSSGQEVPWEEIVRGYEYEENQYVVLTDADLRNANVKATQTVEIVNFAARSDIPDIYFEKPYFLEPMKQGEKGYVLLRETLRRTGRVGIAKVILHTRQHLAALEPLGDALGLNLLRFHHELRDPKELKIPTADVKALNISQKEIEMAERLVEGMIEAWDPTQYREDYRDDLMAMIQQKIGAGKTHDIEDVDALDEPRSADIVDLMTLLKRSVEQTAKSRQRKAPIPKSAHSRKKRA